ncbi:uncharacterized protein FA14DRAFT_174102 [Meira miltonrushii]|uniref:26S proteasome complex subunit SEM1 n=1 Tax=Meira miltonrushii TaxID=1280837 RepID=A0A316VAA7_9BASI|nr:uncharacterized protein FA14DRAFT_174102 [Meira miltonrushii]PWN34436.1 hypothetical protein FA14DRAFT_174102 [Meira miltonrushii]
MAEQKKDEKATSAATTGSSNTNGAAQQQPQKEIPSLGALDEDDEFEEFEAQDWEDSKTSLAHLNSEGGATGLSMSGEQGGTGDHLWEDNWDDDDVEDDFGKALRAELEKQSGKPGQPMAT